MEITSPSNPRLRALARLRRRRDRDAAGVTLVEGVEETTLAVGAGARVREVYWCPDLDDGRAEPLLRTFADQGLDVVRLSRQAFEKVAYREGPDGMLAVMEAPGIPLEGFDPGTPEFLLVGEHIEKPGNLGAILRTADAAGVHGVIAADPVSDWGNPNVVRGSKGAVFAVPVVSATTPDTLAWLHGRGVALVAATPDADLLHTEADLRGPIAIAVGAEKEGLSALMLAAADIRVRIPMVGQVDSLNVATSAAILLYEAVRQRGAG
ncbi:TrmH family RNA methyltransferase [Mobilicoccus caccae]|uniref:rRNA methyltransferase n=1 Tax=Mobilicoccus caccae TaxID=1859295 RepID=A0ABQ6IV41_9MICO|nr:RNA methyltransferase [Mobilicoccus caccae]GMA41359.1 rRNA methyltransferase [Mobilicoccus caccae]